MVYVQPAINWVLQNCARYGLKHFQNVNGEPWHLQPIELPNSRGEIEKSLDKFTQWKLSDQDLTPVVDKPVKPIKPSVPVPGGDPPIFLDSPDASRNRWLQRLLNDCGFADPKLVESGQFGADSVEALMRLQRKVGVKDDGRYGPGTATATLAWLST
jgi:Putative peptidoglycan binding domain